MKVAIIGAGVSGLSCAHELEKHGINAEIYEINSYIGEQHPHVSAILEIIHRPIKDSVKYFSKQLGIDIKPLNTVNTIIHNSPNRKTTIKGNFGYLFLRDKQGMNLKLQIYSQLKNTPVFFNQPGDYVPLSKQYDYVVIANGDSNFTEELGCWNERVKTYVRGATVWGDFDPNTLVVWINKDYCKNGYAYLTPYDNKRASVALVVTEVNEKEVDPYWKLFLDTENFTYNIIEEFTLEHKSGHVYPHKLDNLYFAGDAGGVIDPFLGFGQMSSVTMGVMAARSIAQGKDYEKLISNIVKNNIRLMNFRKLYDRTTNFGYDILMTSVGIPGLKHVLYHTPLNIVKIGGFIAGLFPDKEK